MSRGRATPDTKEEHTRSPWMDRDHPGVGSRLEDDLSADVCVIGAGIAGLSVAYELARDDVDVVVLDRSHVGAGETKRSTAHLASGIDDRYHWLEQVHGRAVTKLVAESHTAAIDRIERRVREESIDCGFERVDGYLFAAEGEPVEELDHELYAARAAGLQGVEKVERVPLPGRDVGPGLRFPDQGQMDPLAYVVGLARAVEHQGGRVHTGGFVTRVVDGTPVAVETSRGVTVACDHCVVATNVPFTDTFMVHTKQLAYRTHALAAPVLKGSIPHALFWDTASPYHYVRLAAHPLDAEKDLVIVGGADHRTGERQDPTERWAKLESWARAHVPSMGDVEHHWSGQVYEPADGLALIGRDPGTRHTYLVTGDSGQGTTHGTIAGILIASLIRGESHRWADVYDPGRIMVTVSREYLKDNLDIAENYTDWFTRGDVPSEDLIPRGRGAVVRRGARKVAVYRDEDGELHERSAVCQHLGCIVRWNTTESTWDCPCHGSRYDAYGHVMNGPAVDDLQPTESTAERPPKREGSGGGAP